MNLFPHDATTGQLLPITNILKFSFDAVNVSNLRMYLVAAVDRMHAHFSLFRE
jgi:hypothetical protein